MRIQTAVRFLSCWHSEVTRLHYQLEEIRNGLVRPNAFMNDMLHYQWHQAVTGIDQLSEMCDGGDPEGQSKDIQSLKKTAGEIESLLSKNEFALDRTLN